MKINSGQAPSTLVPKYIGSDFDHVVTVSKNIDYVKNVAEGIERLPVVSYIGEEPPTQPAVGSSWYCTTDGRTYVWYKDVDSSQWVESSPQSAPLDLQDVREVAIANTERQMKLLGYDLVKGSFEEGALLSKSTDVVLYKHTGVVYKWKGVFPAQIAANSSPTGTGISNWEEVVVPVMGASVREALRRSYAEAGYNLVDGSFEAGGTLVNVNDVLLQERTGKAFSGPTGTVAAMTTPTGGVFVDKSGELLRHELATSNGATKVGTSDGRTVEQRLAALPNEVDAAGTAASLIDQHNNDYFAHTHLTEQIAAEVDRAELAASEAEAARDAAIATAGPLYATVAAGRSAVADGQTFAVQGTGDIAADIYRRTNSTTQVLIASLPSSSFVAKTFAPNENLIVDGGFSSGYAGYIPAEYGDIHKYQLDGQGHASVKTEFLTESSLFELFPVFKISGSNKYPAVAGEKFTLSAEFNVDVPTELDTTVLARLSLRCFNSVGAQLLRVDTNITKLTRSGFNTGARNSVTITAPAGTAYMTGHLYRQLTTGYSVYGIGNVKIEKGDLSPYSADAPNNFDKSNLIYDPASTTFQPTLENAVVERDVYGESTVVYSELGVPTQTHNYYVTNKIEHRAGDIFSFAFELDAAGETGAAISAQIRGFDANGVGVWTAFRTIPLSGTGLQWGPSPVTRTLTCFSAAPSSDVKYVVGRLVSINGHTYTKLRAKNFSLKRGLSNYDFVPYRSDIPTPPTPPDPDSFDTVGWAIGNSASYFTGEAPNAYIPKPAALGVTIDTPPNVIPVTSATHITATRQLIMAPGVEKTGSRLWAAYSANTVDAGESPHDFNIIQYSDDDGVSWVEAFYWKSAAPSKYRLNTPHLHVEDTGELTFLTGYDAANGSDVILGGWAFTIKNPQKTSGNFVCTRSWRVLPTGYPNGIFDSDARKIIIGGTPTGSGLTEYRGINFYKFDSKNRWLNREAKYMPIAPAKWEEAQAVQLTNGSHMLMFRTDANSLKVAYSASGLDAFTGESSPAFLPATTASRFALRMSPTGRLYLLYNAATNRKNLTLALLNASGTAVDKTILVEPRQTFLAAYPDLKFVGDSIYMAWDYIRSTAIDSNPEIVMVKLSEADFVANGSSAILTTKVIATKNQNPHA